MDYEKAYKEALKRAKILYNDKNEIGYANAESVLEEVFPLLKEPEDEKIKKEIISFIQDDIDEINLKVSGDYDDRDEDDIAHQNWCKKAIAWLENIPYTIDHENREGFHLGYKAGLEKQGEQEVNEPDWCHHKVDLSDCSEEYRKAYYDGWNNCNQQHSQCNAEQKPAWSEEDEEHYKACLQYFDEVNPDMVYYKDYQWLKSLKQRIGG